MDRELPAIEALEDRLEEKGNRLSAKIGGNEADADLVAGDARPRSGGRASYRAEFCTPNQLGRSLALPVNRRRVRIVPLQRLLMNELLRVLRGIVVTKQQPRPH